MADAGELKAVISAETSDFISKMNEVASVAENASSQAASGMQPVGDALDGIKSHAEEAGSAMEGFGESIASMAEFAGFNVGLEQAVELLKDFATEAVNAFSSTEVFTAAMTGLTGSAESAEGVLSSLKNIAATSLFNLPQLEQAAQKMSAFGFAAEDIPSLMNAAADAATALGHPVQSVADVFDTVYSKGVLMKGALPELGLKWQDLADVLGGTATSLKEVTAEFNSIQDPMDKVQILADLVTEKFHATREEIENSLTGQVHALKTEWDLLLEAFGKEVAPDLKTVTADLQAIMPLLESIVAKVAEWAAIQLGQFLTALTDIKSIFTDIASVLPNVKTYMDGLLGAFTALTGLKVDTNSVLAWLKDIATGAVLPGIQNVTGAIHELKTKTDDLTGALSYNLPLLDPQMTSAHDKLTGKLGTTTTATVDLTGKMQTLTVSTISQLNALGLLGQAPDPFKTLDEQGQKLFDDFGRGFQGIFDDWNTAAAGIDPEKLLGKLQTLQAQFVQAGATGTTQFGLVTDAITMLGTYMENHLSPDTTRVGQDLSDAATKGFNAFSTLATKITTEADKHPLDPLVAAMKQLGIEGDTAQGKVTNDLNAIATLLQSHITTMGDIDAAWIKLTGDASKYANDPQLLPKIISAQKDLVQSLTDQGAPLGDIYQKDATILQEEITLATTRGENAGTYQIALTNLKIAQQALIDQSTLWGNAYTTFMTDMQNALTGPQGLGSALSKTLIDGGNWHDTFIGWAKSLASEILDNLVNTALKALEDSLLKQTGLLSGLSSGVSGLFKSGSGGSPISPSSLPMSPANNPMGPLSGTDVTGGNANLSSGGAGGMMGQSASGIMGGINVVTGAITAVSSIISNFQNARQENTLNAIELNTRLCAMFIGGLGDGGVQTWTNLTAQYTSKLMDLDSWIHDAWVELLGGKDTIIGLLGGGGWLHQFMATAVGPDLDQIAGNTNQMLTAINSLAGVVQSAASGSGGGGTTGDGTTKAGGGQGPVSTSEPSRVQVTINAPALTTSDAAKHLGNQIANNLANQMVGGTLR